MILSPSYFDADQTAKFLNTTKYAQSLSPTQSAESGANAITFTPGIFELEKTQLITFHDFGKSKNQIHPIIALIETSLKTKLDFNNFSYELKFVDSNKAILFKKKLSATENTAPDLIDLKISLEEVTTAFSNTSMDSLYSDNLT